MSRAAVWLLTRLGRIKVTLAYAAALVLVSLLLRQLGPHGRRAAIQNASTNLHNLGEGSFTTLIDSAFITGSEYIVIWLPGLIALLALAEVLWQSRLLVVGFVVGHVGTTLIVALGIAVALRTGLVSDSVAEAADVGMSYGAVAVLGTLTAALPQGWRSVWTGGWLAIAAGSVVFSGADFTTVGHAIALVLGIVLSNRFGEPQPWTATRCGLLIMAMAFGYLMIAYGYAPPGSSATLGLSGGLVGMFLSRAFRPAQTNSSALASIQSDNHSSGGHSSSSPGISHS